MAMAVGHKIRVPAAIGVQAMVMVVMDVGATDDGAHDTANDGAGRSSNHCTGASANCCAGRRARRSRAKSAQNKGGGGQR